MENMHRNIQKIFHYLTKTFSKKVFKEERIVTEKAQYEYYNIIIFTLTLTKKFKI